MAESDFGKSSFRLNFEILTSWATAAQDDQSHDDQSDYGEWYDYAKYTSYHSSDPFDCWLVDVFWLVGVFELF